jgi:hypothetical protein
MDVDLMTEQPGVGIRVACSFRALALVWLISGVVFCFAVKGPGTLVVWIIYGTFFFMVGWILVGLPLIAMGNRVCHVPALSFAALAGLCGSFIVELPTLIIYILSLSRGPQRLTWAFSDLVLPSAAFSVAASVAVLYRTFLIKKGRPGITT